MIDLPFLILSILTFSAIVIRVVRKEVSEFLPSRLRDERLFPETLEDDEAKLKDTKISVP